MLNLIKLENRIVLDGAAVGEALDHAAEHEAHMDAADDVHSPDNDLADQQTEAVSGAAALLAESSESLKPMDIIVISDNLPDYQTLADSADPNAQVIIYDADAETAEDVVNQIVETAQKNGQPIDSLTILSHGGSGYFNLGNEAVTAENIAENSEAWESLNTVMAQDAHLYVYGCNVAEAPASSLINGLADAVGANVFASDDVTGKDGDWDLEVSSKEGTFDSHLMTEKLDGYSENLAEEIHFASNIRYGANEDQLGTHGLVVYIPENIDPGLANLADKYNVEVASSDDLLYSVKALNVWIEAADAPQKAGYNAYRALIQHVPTENASGNATIDATLTDKTTGSTIDTAPGIQVNISPINDAPLLDNSQDLTWGNVDENATDPAGKTVSSIVSDIITDVDGNTTGIAVTDVDNTLGTWQYNTGSGWTDFGTVSEQNAVVLDQNAQIRFVPNKDAINNYVKNTENIEINDNKLTLDESLTFRAWDQTDGHNSGDTNVNTVDPNEAIQAYPSDTWAYSSDTNYNSPQTNTTVTGSRDETISVTINLINDKPELSSPEDQDYVENDPAQIITPDITITDIDSNSLNKATVQITGNYQNDDRGQDILRFDNTSNISGTWDADTGTLTLTGTATLAEYQAALRSVKFEHIGGLINGDDPNENARTVTVAVTDDTDEASGPVTLEVNVDAINDAPVLSPPTGSFTYVENSGPVAIDANMDLTDVDDDNMTGAVIQITSNYKAVEDTLAFTNQNGITGSWDSATGTLTLTGTADKAAYETALQSVTYENSSENPNSTARQITFTVTDANSRGVGDGPGGGQKDASVIRTININAVNDPPDVDPDPDNPDNPDPDNPDTEKAVDFENTFIEDGDPVNVVDSDAAITDPDSEKLVSLSVTIRDKHADDVLAIAGNALDGTNISGSYNSSTGVLSLTGEDTIANYENVLRNIMFENTSQNPGETSVRTLAFVAVDDQGLASLIAKSKITVIPVNDPPILDLDSTDGVPESILKTDQRADGLILSPEGVDVNYETEFVPGQGAVSLTNAGVLSDVDDTDLSQLTATITNFQTGDVLGFDTSGTSITGNYANGVLTLSGVDSIANYQKVLNSITFNNTSDTTQFTDSNGLMENRKINFVAKDNGDSTGVIESSNLATATVSIGNVKPSIDLDPGPDPGGDGGDGPGGNPAIGPDFHVIYIEKHPTTDGGADPCPPVNIADADAVITDPDSDSLSQMAVILTNNMEDDVLGYDSTITNENGITVTTTEENGQMILKFEGTASLQTYTNLLRTITFSTAGDDPDDTQRVINVQVTDADGNTSDVVKSYVSVVPVNDAPDIAGQDQASTTVNTDIDINNIYIDDKDAGSDPVYVEITVQFGKMTINDNPNVSGSGTEKIIIQNMSKEQVNAMLQSLTYVPPQDYTGQDTMTITVNDQGHSGVNPNKHVIDCDTLNDGNLTTDAGGTLDPDTGQIPDFNNSGTVDDPSAQITTKVIPITITESKNHFEPKPPGTPDVPFIPISQPGNEGQQGILLGPVRLPGPVGITASNVRELGGPGISGERCFDFCSLEEALQLGCRFASTKDLDAKFSSVSWKDMSDMGFGVLSFINDNGEKEWLGPHLDEEYDLYSRLFLRGENDPGFNVPPEAFSADLGGVPDHVDRLFREGGEDFNDMEPGELKETFFAGRKALDKVGRGPEPREVPCEDSDYPKQ